ncbi:pentatricopeptide repeat-containing protein At3g22690-like [Phoenix dactylifera]|uniref:Pentatricopeptide repeat-containing protein At3g22690-like n=1 Tax=Phoenix dactylifera TaxID=42345 RepID=A0A8B7D2T6_PHODC|nr:pentatricopeptide repeat-containing protein At3g22690-like [Phoenix dactylifera]
MAAVLASNLPQRLPKTFFPVSSPSSPRLPSLLRRSGRRPHPALHSAPPADWPLEQRLEESLSVLDLMDAQSISPDPALLCTLLNACADARNLRLGRLVHDRAARAGLQAHPAVANGLLRLYSRCGLLGAARRLFDEMPERNVATWTTAIAMYLHAGFPRDAVQLYCSMTAAAADTGVRPNAFTYTIALNSCASIGDLELGIQIHEEIKRDGCEQDEFVTVALIDMYAKCGRVGDAREVFNKAQIKTVEACTAMIEGYNRNGKAKEAMDVIRSTLQNGRNSEVASRLGFATMIRPCVVEMALRQGQEIHAHIIKFRHQPGMKTLGALVELYEKCDKMEIAYRVFDSLVAKKLGLWSRMIAGFVRNGLCEEALKLYLRMVCLDIGMDTFIVFQAIKACVGVLGLEEAKQMHGRVIKLGHLLEGSVIGGLGELYSECGEQEKVYKLLNQKKILQK